MTINRADGFYCRHCGSPLPPPPRGTQTEMTLGPHKVNFLTPALRLALNERSDSFPIASSQSRLWLLTSNNNLKIVENRADGLGLYSTLTGKHGLEDLQTAITYLEPQSAPVVFRDRLVLFGTRKMFSFSIHPHANRWLQDRREVAFPEQWQPLFNSEISCCGGQIELPIALADSRQFALLGLSMEAVMGTAPVVAQPLSQPTGSLLVGALDPACHYYWAKDLKQGAGQLFYFKRQGSNRELVPVDSPPLLFFIRPVMIGERVYAVTAEHRLIELGLQRGEVVQQRKLNQVDKSARALLVTHDKIIVAVHEGLFFFDYQTGELLAVASDIDASHLFVDSQGTLLAIHRNGRFVMMNPANPLERWGDEDATSDDSRVFDAFIAHNSLYSLSENGEVCRFDFN